MKAFLRPEIQKNCSSCGVQFDCGAESVETTCWCARLPRVSLVTDSDQDCLCPTCLPRAIARITRQTTTPPVVREDAARSCEPLVDGDFYFEDGAMVFTTQYHLRRGYCCENGCRHCPY